jgi:hypothetical protein
MESVGQHISDARIQVAAYITGALDTTVPEFDMMSDRSD